MAGEVDATVQGFLIGVLSLADVSPAAHPCMLTLFMERSLTSFCVSSCFHSAHPVGHSNDTSPPCSTTFFATFSKFPISLMKMSRFSSIFLRALGYFLFRCCQGDPAVHGSDAQRWMYSPGATFVTALSAACRPSSVVRSSTMVSLKTRHPALTNLGWPRTESSLQQNSTSLRSEILVSFLLAMGLGTDLDCATMESNALSLHALSSEFHDDFATALVLRMRMGHVIFLALGTGGPRRSSSGAWMMF